MNSHDFIKLLLRNKSQLGQKLREEHPNSSIVHVEDGSEDGNLVGEERSVFEKFLSLSSKQVICLLNFFGELIPIASRK